MKTTANKITIVRILLVPVFLVLAYLGYGVLAFIVYLVACFSDFLDGYIAREYNQVSKFGKFMDPLADKMLVISAMCFLTEMQRFPGWALAIVCLREFAVSGLRMVAAESRRVIAAGKSGKVKTAVTMIGLAIMLIFNNRVLDCVVIALIVITTVYSGAEYFINNKSVLSEEEK